MPRKTMAQMEQENEKLIKEKDSLQELVAAYENKDERRREILTRILKERQGQTKSEMYGIYSVKENYTWLEIASEIGKLMAARNFYDFEGNISEMDEAIKSIIKDLHGEKENCDRNCRC